MKTQTGIFKKLTVYFAIMLALGLAFASPPEIPVLIYGKVVTDSGDGLGGVDVKASWVEEGELKSAVSKTLEGDLEGQYKFFIQPSSSINNIKLESLGESVLFKAESGLINHAPDIVVEDKRTTSALIDYVSSIFGGDEEESVETLPKSPEAPLVDEVEGDLEKGEISGYSEGRGVEESLTEEYESEIIEEGGEELIEENVSLTKDKAGSNINYSYYESNREISSDNHFSPVIDRLNEEIYVCEGEKLIEFFNVSDRDGDETIVWTSSDKFYLETINSEKGYSKIMLFSDVIEKEDVGDYPVKVFASDKEYVDIKEITIFALEVNSKPIIRPIPLMTIPLRGDDYDFSYLVYADDLETTGLSYSLNTLSGKNIFKINDKGEISSFLKKSDVGVYDLEVCVVDEGVESVSNLCGGKGPNEVCEKFSLTVTENNSPPEILKKYPEGSFVNFSSENEVSFNLEGDDGDGTVPDVYWYVDGVLEKHDRGSKYSSFTYSSPCVEGREVNVRSVITDGLLNDTEEWVLNQEYCDSEEMSSLEFRFVDFNFSFRVVLSILFLALGFVLILVAIRFLRLRKMMEVLK